MQLKITLTSQGLLTLPLAYQHPLQSMIYNALDDAFAAFLHDSGYAADDRTMKLFTFGRLHGQSYRIRSGTITFTPPVTLEIRSPVRMLVLSAVAGFAAGSVHCLCGRQCVVTACQVSDTIIQGDTLDIVMDSPVTAYDTAPDGHTKPYTPGEPQFERLIRRNAERKWLAFHGTPAPGALRISPARVTASDKVVTQYKGFRITAWLGRYRLEAPAAVLDLLYNAGLGTDSPKGFGMFQAVSDPAVCG